MPIRPLGKRILIEPLPNETMSHGLHLPDYAVEKQCQGHVRAVSNKFGKEHEVPEVGEHVWYRQGYGTQVEVNGKLHILIEHEYVLGVIT